MSAAPFHTEIARGPDGVRAQWISAQDGVRLRSVIWPEGGRGTVLLFSGRTEYAEKYGPAADQLRRRGYASATLDWRGQGLSDRSLRDPLVGHIGDFAEYQRDVAAFVAHVRAQGLPEPYHLLAHSMGGSIGLRALQEGLAVRSACFSAPMWGIRVHAALRVVAAALGALARRTGLGHRYVPGTGTRSYVVATAFEANVLTRDREMFAWMQDQLARVPELGLAGPSLDWLRAAFAETHRLSHLPSPRLPALCIVGSAEKVVDLDEIRRRMDGWRGGELQIVPGAEHEVMMDRPEVRDAFFDAATALFDRAAEATPLRSGSA
ncbi:alpha/beta hydrolase [Cereibacter azotoformans]|uniref:Alpha/beta hydrolase fold n=1 Tax=Cereibacter sphaeroides (strain ATCC 17025 / ATH 2.4.3) TaxID=349102 RepID=A4WSU2_CERS5|nr:alpha/beta hydrolase [Cereibacter azotoformans]ULB09758.1 alpha/beta hydrolase [Cereibacter azotoformans]